MGRKEEEHEGVYSLAVSFGEVILGYNANGRLSKHVVVGLSPEINECYTSKIIKGGRRKRLALPGSISLEDVVRKTDEKWSVEDIIQGLSANQLAKLSPERIAYLRENSRKLPMTLIRG
jgi:hypothetical protein